MRDLLLAANDTRRLRQVYDVQVAQFPDDHLTRLRIGTHYLDAGDVSECLKHYRAAVAAKPALLTILADATSSRREWLSKVQSAGRMADYAALFDGVDFGRVGSIHAVAEVITPLLTDPTHRPAGVRLVTQALAALPDDRLEL